MADRAIFRERAIDAHRRRTERDVLPRLISGRIVVCSWLLLATLMAGVVVAWTVRVPSYVAGSGVVLAARHGTAGVLFVPPDQAAHLRAGRPVHAQIGSSGTFAQGEIVRIERGLIGPDAARNRYRLPGGSDAVSQPSTVVRVQFGRPLPPAAYAGSRLTARIGIGSRRLLTLVAGGGT